MYLSNKLERQKVENRMGYSMSKRGDSVVFNNNGVWEGTEWLKESEVESH